MGVRLVLLVLALVASATATAGPAGAARTGFFFGLHEDAAATLTRGVPFARDLGATAFRIPLQWRPGLTRLEPSQRADLDRLVAAAPRGLRLVANPWSAGPDAPLDDARRDEFCAFARDVVVNYRRVTDVVVGNEPNKDYAWHPQFNVDGTSAAPAAFAALLARCWTVLHAVRPGVNVVAPALSPTGNDNPGGSNISHSPVRFLERMGEAYRASGRTRRLFDTFAHNVYGSTPYERPWRDHTSNQISQGDWRDLLNVLRLSFGGTGQPIPGECRPVGRCVWLWYTEAGFQTTPDEAKRPLYVDEENVVTIPDEAGGEPLVPAAQLAAAAPDQATQFVDAVRLAYCQPYVQGIFNYLLVDNRSLGRWQSGLLWTDWTPKDSYAAAKAVIAEARSGRVDCAALKGGPVPVVDARAPRAPRWIGVSAGSRRVVLDWRDARDGDVMGYRVLRAARPGGRWRLLTPRLLTASRLVDRRVRNGQRYAYVVTAVDTVEHESARSRVRTVTPRPRR